MSCFEKIESSMVIDEVFNRQVYPLELSKVTERPLIFDFGANVGIFVHYAKWRYPGAIIHAVEPAPPVASALRENVKPFGQSVHVHEGAISDREGEGMINFYPGYSVMSGLIEDTEANEKLLSSCVKEDLLRKLPTGRVVGARHVKAALAGRLDSPRLHPCQLFEVNSFLQRNAQGFIDYLKMDVEGGELGIARHVTEQNWARIGSVAIEVHEYEGREASAPRLLEILRRQGFVTKTVQGGGDGENRTLMLYGIRRGYTGRIE